MKYIIILGDGMADEPIDMLGGKTPLQAANKPAINKLAQLGRSGMLDTIPEGFKPGSEIANLSVLGYNLHEVFEGRGVLEAASMRVDIAADEMAMRCNLITIENGKIKNHSAGHISNEEAKELITYLQEELGGEANGEGGLYADFFSGVSYRHLLRVKNGVKELKCAPPHDELGTPFKEIMIKATSKEAQQTADFLNKLTLRSQELLEKHPINLKRVASGKDPANSIWLWSPGYRPKMESLIEKYELSSGAVISAVDLIKGIGTYAELESIEVEGATGLFNTNYEGKAQAALDALKRTDFVFLHIEASDEAGHEGDVKLKVKTIEDIDSRVVGPILEEIQKWDEPVTVALLPDHPTPCRIQTHTSDPIPFIIYSPNQEPDKVVEYDEFASQKGAYGLLVGDEFMDALIKKNR